MRFSVRFFYSVLCLFLLAFVVEGPLFCAGMVDATTGTCVINEMDLPAARARDEIGDMIREMGFNAPRVLGVSQTLSLTIFNRADRGLGTVIDFKKACGALSCPQCLSVELPDISEQREQDLNITFMGHFGGEDYDANFGYRYKYIWERHVHCISLKEPYQHVYMTSTKNIKKRAAAMEYSDLFSEETQGGPIKGTYTLKNSKDMSEVFLTWSGESEGLRIFHRLSVVNEDLAHPVVSWGRWTPDGSNEVLGRRCLNFVPTAKDERLLRESTQGQ